MLALALGLATAIFGVMFAAVQGDMKRLLAYSSIENIGLLLTGIGLVTPGFLLRQTKDVLGFRFGLRPGDGCSLGVLEALLGQVVEALVAEAAGRRLSGLAGAVARPCAVPPAWAQARRNSRRASLPCCG